MRGRVSDGGVAVVAAVCRKLLALAASKRTPRSTCPPALVADRHSSQNWFGRPGVTHLLNRSRKRATNDRAPARRQNRASVLAGSLQPLRSIQKSQAMPAALPDPRMLSRLASSVLASPYFCSGFPADRSSTPRLGSGAATNQKSRLRAGDCWCSIEAALSRYASRLAWRSEARDR
jgi:hypothetical protein